MKGSLVWLGAIVLGAVGLAVAVAGAGSARAAFPGGNGLVAWSQLAGAKTGIYAAKADGTGLRLLVKGASSLSLAWSPDGKRLLYASGGAAVAVNANGSGRKVLARAAGGTLIDGAVWSPDGRRVAYTAGPIADGDLYLVAASGGTPRRLTRTPGVGESDPVWLPDGGTILYLRTSKANDVTPLYSLDVKTGRTRQVVADFPGSWLDLSPDGTRLAWGACPDLCHVYVSGRDGSHPQRLTAREKEDRFPVWSPDGKSLAFARSFAAIDNSDREQVVVIPAAGGPATVVREIHGKIGAVSWQPLSGGTPPGTTTNPPAGGDPIVGLWRIQGKAAVVRWVAISGGYEERTTAPFRGSGTGCVAVAGEALARFIWDRVKGSKTYRAIVRYWARTPPEETCTRSWKEEDGAVRIERVGNRLTVSCLEKPNHACPATYTRVPG